MEPLLVGRHADARLRRHTVVALCDVGKQQHDFPVGLLVEQIHIVSHSLMTMRISREVYFPYALLFA